MIFEEKFYPIETYNVGIDSSFRDMTKYPNSSEYIIHFENVFKSVVSVQLVFAVYEKNGIENYVNLYIEELSPNLISNSPHVSGSFCQLPMLHPQNTYNTSLYKCIKTFQMPLEKLSRFSIKFVKSNGETYAMREHFLKFEIQCLKLSGKTKEWSNNELFTQSISLYEPSPRLLRVPDCYDMNILKTAFKSVSSQLKSQQLPASLYQTRYNELKEEFKSLASKLQKGL